MSSAVFSTSAAEGRPFLFDDAVAESRPQPTGAELFGEPRPPRRVIAAGAFNDARLAGMTPASRLTVRPAPEMVSSGIAAMDALTGGLPRGCLTEICGPASSGRTTLLLSALAAATHRGEFCAVVDASDALDPQSMAGAGIALERLLWVRCGENSSERSLEQLLRATDLLLESGGFGMIALDLGELPPQTARRIPLTTWFRFRRAVEHTSTVLLAIERQSIAGSCSSLLLDLKSLLLDPKSRIDTMDDISSFAPTHAQLFTGVEITAELIRSRMDRKPTRSAEITFTNKTAWAG
jgi:hypothetical protein